ncbi:hypothetical protein, partial [Escherichia coli]|uniref:hypothetical protein n=1 Tax=Escherichia coli TaxID=562 RepID=UPI003F480BBD
MEVDKHFIKEKLALQIVYCPMPKWIEQHISYRQQQLLLFRNHYGPLVCLTFVFNEVPLMLQSPYAL